jgi:hypothetical protein
MWNNSSDGACRHVRTTHTGAVPGPREAHRGAGPRTDMLGTREGCRRPCRDAGRAQASHAGRGSRKGAGRARASRAGHGRAAGWLAVPGHGGLPCAQGTPGWPRAAPDHVGPPRRRATPGHRAGEPRRLAAGCRARPQFAPRQATGAGAHYTAMPGKARPGLVGAGRRTAEPGHQATEPRTRWLRPEQGPHTREQGAQEAMVGIERGHRGGKKEEEVAHLGDEKTMARTANRPW